MLGRRAGGLIAISLVVLGGCGRKHPDAPPRSPEESLKSIRINPDFRVELFASEPEVFDPVEMAFDENGRIYVAEMLDYPEDPPPGKPARSRIRELDIDGAGKIVRNTIFADHVLEVSGLLPWHGGLLVTAAPDILFFQDTDGDGQADVRKVLYTGFPKVNPEGRITNLRLGTDNWIYAANAGADGKITSPDHPERPPILVRGADFRFRPDRGLAEAASGPAQFGIGMDDWGNRFITQNTIHVRHVVMPMQYLARAPLLEAGAVAQDISDHGRPSAQMFPLTQPQAWRRQRTQIRQQRYDEQKRNFIEQVAGYFTAASGGTVYTGDVFPRPYWGNLFTGDVSANLVHRDVLIPDGESFIAHRGEEGKEFLASTDMWFRPCNFANAPDGNLYVMDIYREFIETPESIPVEIKKSMDFWSGVDKGRIYRIVPVHPLGHRDLKTNLGKATSAELVRELAGTNGWNRQTAHRLLVERQDRSVAPQLAGMAQTNPDPLARLHALWTLEGLSELDETMVLAALKDPHPGIRENAIRLAEAFLPRSPALAKALEGMTKAPEARVQFQLALSLGAIPDRRAREALAQIGAAHQQDRWFRLAVLSSAGDAAAELFGILAARGEKFASGEFLAQIGALIGAKHDPGEVARFLAGQARVAHPEAGLSGLARGMQLTGVSDLRVPGAEPVLARYLAGSSDAVERAAWDVARHLELQELVRKAAADALAANLPVARRVTAVRALRGGRYEKVGPVLRTVLESHAPPQIEMAAVDALAAFDRPEVATTLLAFWKSYSPEARQEALGAMLSQRDRIPLLIQALEARQIDTASVDVAGRARLLELGDPQLAARAKALFRNQNTDRAKVVASYHDALKLHGDVARGKKLFEDTCARCHMPRRQGGRVGPDLSGINNKSREELLTSILNPSYAIEARYTNYLITTRDGRLHDGVIASETPAVIVLRGGTEEGDDTILRRNILEVRASGISLMPEGLEDSLGRQGIADVIAYLQGGL